MFWTLAKAWLVGTSTLNIIILMIVALAQVDDTGWLEHFEW